MFAQVFTRVVHTLLVVLQLREIEKRTAILPIEEDLRDDATDREHVHRGVQLTLLENRVRDTWFKALWGNVALLIVILLSEVQVVGL